jgi:hypothetical protein
VAIASSSGQIGFLQQLIDNSAVLHEAIARLNYKRTGNLRAARASASTSRVRLNRAIGARLLT